MFATIGRILVGILVLACPLVLFVIVLRKIQANKRRESEPASSGRSGGACRMRHQNRAMSVNHSSNPMTACTLIQNTCVRFGQESCSSPRVPTTISRRNMIQ